MPNVLKTDPTINAILSMCSTHSMDGCQNCTDATTNCPNPLHTVAKLCWGMMIVGFYYYVDHHTTICRNVRDVVLQRPLHHVQQQCSL